ncbi:hypothetical protein J2S40_003224 [Nocardioides luteus]|uniref:DUF1905 domain-containing protein n=1 Tax=Nocardioides luteus TaxID=1844 RepID=A0ABQ5SW66_9ACTN|nr:DUF1905 domain-containing protein [Nocardioides luteus]MDR7312166.1 hypothetical protein [Nocardioides luteus]GGR56434.1 hypothetical protein GCM10010197_23910 [Nocardioides luteus]GLJ68412.1 hypothetical protein GCM10017579_24480 [Nocardioides luteus]
MDSWEFEAELWPWKDETDAWIFVSAPPEVTEEIREASAATGPPRGFGSVRVEARIGATTWRTSVFPGQDGYALPVKKDVRRREDLEVGDRALVSITLI